MIYGRGSRDWLCHIRAFPLIVKIHLFNYVHIEERWGSIKCSCRFLSSRFLTTLLLWFWCLLLPLTSPSLFPCARYSVWDTHLVHGIPVPYCPCTSFATSSKRLKTLHSLVYNNNNYIYHSQLLLLVVTLVYTHSIISSLYFRYIHECIQIWFMYLVFKYISVVYLALKYISVVYLVFKYISVVHLVFKYI